MHLNSFAQIELYNLTNYTEEETNIAASHLEIVKIISSVLQNEHTYSEIFSLSIKTIIEND